MSSKKIDVIPIEFIYSNFLVRKFIFICILIQLHNVLFWEIAHEKTFFRTWITHIYFQGWIVYIKYCYYTTSSSKQFCWFEGGVIWFQIYYRKTTNTVKKTLKMHTFKETSSLTDACHFLSEIYKAFAIEVDVFWSKLYCLFSQRCNFFT